MKNKKDVKQKTKSVENEKLCAILSYFLVGIIWYFADEKMKESEFAKYHAKQGLVLIIASIAYSIILQILVSIFILPLILTGLWVGLGMISILYYVPLIWAIIGLVNAANGQTKELPLIGKYAEKFNF